MAPRAGARIFIIEGIPYVERGNELVMLDPDEDIPNELGEDEHTSADLVDGEPIQDKELPESEAESYQGD